jgi:membrane protein DedA with SNARE-associated domain
MTGEAIGAVVRTVIQLVSGLAIAKGIGDEQMWLAISGGLVSVVSGVWSWYWIAKKTA